MATSPAPTAPASRNDFEVAIVCALRREYDAVIELVERFWDDDGDRYGRCAGDSNQYTTGYMGNANVVIVLLNKMGKASSAAAVASLRSSYPGLQFALLTGICGGAPTIRQNNQVVNIFLGDVVISTSIVQYDYGRRYADGFKPKTEPKDLLGLPSRNVQSLLGLIDTDRGYALLEKRTELHLKCLQAEDLHSNRSAVRYAYPGARQDRLFQSDYQHKHQDSAAACECASHRTARDPVCEASRQLSCVKLGCDEKSLVIRDQQAKHRKATAPAIYTGKIGSGDTVLKSGEDRDNIVREHGVIAFEMEGAGMWEELPCIVVKGVCDYADSHKDKEWQDYAAATAASVSMALIERYAKRDPVHLPIRPTPVGAQEGNQVIRNECRFSVPLPRNKNFVVREAIIESLKEQLYDQDEHQRAAIVGLGGMGKTQIALHLAYSTKDTRPEYSVYWLPVLSLAGFKQACEQLLRKLGISCDAKENPVEVLQNHLNSDAVGKWLLIVDNADDQTIVLDSPDGGPGIYDMLPNGDNGCILVTTRSWDVAAEVAGDEAIRLDEMSHKEAADFLGNVLGPQSIRGSEAQITQLLEKLTYLPLAISQAAAYMKRNRISAARYLGLMNGTSQDLVGLMSREFPDRTRYPKSANATATNAIITTWLVSFEQIRKIDPEAADLLQFISCIEPKAIPVSMLPLAGTEEEQTRAVGTLCSYAFVTRRDDQETLEMHSLVHLATVHWVKQEGSSEDVMENLTGHLGDIFPRGDWDNRELWRQYLPHALRVIYTQQDVQSVSLVELGYRVGWCLDTERRTHEAIAVLSTTTQIADTILAGDHPDRLASQHMLARVYLANGQIKEAVRLLEKVVFIREKVLTENQTDRLASQHELAKAYLDDGQIKEAVQILEKVVDEGKVLAEDHPDRLASQHELARAYLQNGQIKEAVRLLEKVVDIEEKVLGENHSDRLISQHELAGAYLDNGRVEEATSLYTQVLESDKRVLGLEHPHTLVSMGNLALAFHKQGRLEEAESLEQQVLEMKKRVLGEKHPETLTTMNNLACTWYDLEKFQDAIVLMRECLQLVEEVLGPQHPDTITSQELLERWTEESEERASHTSLPHAEEEEEGGALL